ncbi:MAG: PAS domain-containing sensor histidine kinase [bacterium]|nr:PAS domain-containing sensor histidine kinase [bacterium]
MDTLLAQGAHIVQNVEDALVANPMFPLYAAAILILLVAWGIAHAVISAPVRAERKFAGILRDLDAVREKLNEAEKIGNLGSFLWDFENPSESFWSEEMYILCGLVSRKTPPTISAFIDTSHKEDRENAQTALDTAQKQPGSFSFVFRTVAPSGQVRYLRVHGMTILKVDKKPRRIQGVAHDITQETEVDRAKSEFVSLASHQLKTPLTSVKWFAEALLNGSVGELSAEQRKYVINMESANQNMIHIVNDLLNVSRIELGVLSMRYEDIDICELAQSVIEEQRQTANDKDVTLKLMCPSTSPHMNADRTLVRMVLQNLISNAVKYSMKNGRVECELTTSGVKRETILIRVSDTGIGIPKEEQPHIFEKLHRASNAKVHSPDGTGLGLYLVKTILERIAGGITFESAEGKGTTFFASIPLKAEEKTTADIKRDY